MRRLKAELPRMFGKRPNGTYITRTPKHLWLVFADYGSDSWSGHSFFATKQEAAKEAREARACGAHHGRVARVACPAFVMPTEFQREW